MEQIKTAEEIIKFGNEEHSFRDVIDNLTDFQILESIDQYAAQFYTREQVEAICVELLKIANSDAYNTYRFEMGEDLWEDEVIISSITHLNEIINNIKK